MDKQLRLISLNKELAEYKAASLRRQQDLQRQVISGGTNITIMQNLKDEIIAFNRLIFDTEININKLKEELKLE